MSIVADDAYVDDTKTFSDLNLDPRLNEAVKKLGFKNPTLVQSHAIPLAKDGKYDIIAKASTGSGKTAAYLLPIFEGLLIDEKSDIDGIKAVILVPTKELANQVYKTCESLLSFCGGSIKARNVSNTSSNKILKSVVDSQPDVLIATPNKLLSLLKSGNEDSLLDAAQLSESLRYFVLDEVDLILSYGYEEDLTGIQETLDFAKINMQSFLMSATLSDEITQELKEKFCKNPKILRINDEMVVKNKDRLIQYYINTNEFDKFLMVFVILKLNLIKGKTLLFVNNIERGYRLKLFLEQFGIRSCLLNSELPINSRLHVIDQYNKNYYNLLIATDEANGAEIELQKKEMAEGNEKEAEYNDTEGKKEETNPNADANTSTKTNTKTNTKANRTSKRADKEFGVSRGVDFKNVACVLNFDLPTTSRNYVHRIGRTARANKSGISLSFVVKSKEWGKNKHVSLLSAKKDEKIFARILNKQQKLGLDVIPYKFNQDHIESFRYRVEDALRAVTGTAIREARIREIKQEILTSDKLRRHFDENPQDLEALRHDRELHTARVQDHLKNVPNYLLPEGLKQKTTNTTTFVPFNKHRGKVRKNKPKSRGRKKNNPLKSFRT